MAGFSRGAATFTLAPRQQMLQPLKRRLTAHSVPSRIKSGAGVDSQIFI